MSLDISVRKSDQVCIVAIAGSIDAFTAGQITECLVERIDGGDIWIVLDLTQVAFMSSAGLRIFLAAWQQIRRAGGNLHLAGARAGVDRVLDMAGLYKIMDIFDRVEDAVSRFGNG